MRTLTAEKEGPLLDYLFQALQDTKKTRIRELLKLKCISVNGVVTTHHRHPLLPGDKISIQTGKKEFQVQPYWNVEIVYEDDYLVVAQKPSGLLTIATEKVQKQTAFYSVNEYLNRKERAHEHSRHHSHFQKLKLKKEIFIVHRLDRDTSGLLVFAKDEDVKFWMQENWGKVRKSYYAVVEGFPKEKAGTVTSFLRETKILRMISSPHEVPDSKFAITHYKVLEAGPAYSLLEIDLETGRKHQIRVHLAGLGCPVAGDKDYGAKTNPAGRLALHAYALSFEHPVTGERKEFRSDLPPPLKRLLQNTLRPL